MHRPNPFLLGFVLLLFIGLLGGLTLLKGGLYPDTHEGDTYHAIDVLMRWMQGEVPHVDFVTPLGVLAFWPIAEVMKAGHSIGLAFIYTQIGLALLLFPVTVYTAISRFPRGIALGFGLLVLGLILVLSYGTATSGVSISMHYNRWGWAISFLMLALSLMPPRGARNLAIFDGILVGIFAGTLLFLKITFFVALAPVAILSLARVHGARGVAAAFIGGAFVLGGIIFAFGPNLVLAYLGDLQLVVGNPIRPHVGATLSEIIAGPEHLIATLIGLAALLLLRITYTPTTGAMFLLLVAAFLFVSYQNFGNDPIWLAFLALLLLTLRPESGGDEDIGIDLRLGFTATAIAALVTIFPAAFNMVVSPLKHLSNDPARFVSYLPESAGQQDIYIRKDRAFTMTQQIHADSAPGPWAGYADAAGRTATPQLNGVSFPHCEWLAGTRGYFDTHSEALVAGGIPTGSRIFVGDVLSSIWLYGPFEPVSGAAPWYYGGLTGLEQADYLMVPKCAIMENARKVILRELGAQSAVSLDLVYDSAVQAVFAIRR